jgi:predicted CopG family antitoxin
MATISISAEAYLAIVATMPEGSYTALRDDRGGYAIILDRMVLDHLKAMRAPGESYSDVILRLAVYNKRRVTALCFGLPRDK